MTVRPEELLSDRTFNEGLMIMAVSYGLDLAGTGDRAERDRAYARLLKSRLSAYPDQAVGRAFELVLRRCKWRPTLADFLEILDPPAEALAKRAWAEVLALLESRGGMYNTVWNTDGATAEGVRAVGGWHRLSGLRPAETARLYPAFEAAVAGAAARGLSRRPAQVSGIREVDWRTGRYGPPAEITAASTVKAIEGGEGK